MLPLGFFLPVSKKLAPGKPRLTRHTPCYAQIMRAYAKSKVFKLKLRPANLSNTVDGCGRPGAGKAVPFYHGEGLSKLAVMISNGYNGGQLE